MRVTPAISPCGSAVNAAIRTRASSRSRTCWRPRRRSARRIRGAVAGGERPFLLGGCCAELPGALAGARDALGRVGLAYVDGHLDLYDGVSSPTGEAADMPVAVALGFGPSAWVESCGGASVDGSDVAILGFRDLKESLADGMRDPSTVEGLRLADVDEVRDAPADVGRDVAATLTTGPGRYWFHLDVDVLDEEVFPATDYLFAGGLTWEELQPLLGPLLSSPALLGASTAATTRRRTPRSAAVASWWRRCASRPAETPSRGQSEDTAISNLAASRSEKATRW